MPQCRKAERDAIRRYWHTHRAWAKWLWNPNHHRLRLSQEKEGALIVTPPERLQRLLKEAVKTFARAVAWQKLLKCKPAEEHFECWAHDIDEDQKKASQRSASGEGSIPVAEWCEGRFLPELQNEHPTRPNRGWCSTPAALAPARPTPLRSRKQLGLCARRSADLIRATSST